MARILKVVGFVIGALVILLIGVMLAVGLLFDPNDYKDQITAAVDEATGRSLRLEGDLELNLFPRLGIAMGGAEFGNAEGFGDQPFARFDSAELRIGLFPLLARRIEIDRAMLSGLRLNLARNAAGETNWSDLGRDRAGDGPVSVDVDVEVGGGVDVDVEIDRSQFDFSEDSDLDISVDAVEIIDAEVTWQDAVAGQDWALSDFNLTASDFDSGRAFPLDISFQLNGAEVAVSVDSEMQALIDINENRYRLDDLSVNLVGEGDGWPGGSGEASLEFASFGADLDEQTLELEELALEILGLSIRGNLVGRNFMDSLSLEGQVEIDSFNPRSLMTTFNAEIETADADVLGNASASADFYFDDSSMGMRDLRLSLDDSSLTGSAGMQGERFEFDLVVDAVDIDRYLPPASEEDEELPEGAGSVDEIDLPLDRLRDFSANGNLRLNEAQFLGMTFTDANFSLFANDGRMTLTPAGRLYGGTIDGEISIAVQGDAARFGLRQTLANVDMAGVGRDYLKIDALVGTGSVDLDLASVGSRVGEIKRDLDGTASVAITDGAWLGIDIWHQMMRVRAGITGPDAPPLEEPAQTVFERIAIGGPVQDAVMTTDEFTATLPFAAINGEGTIDLLTTEMSLRARAGLIDGPVLQQDPVLAEYAGGQIPLRISGTLDSPLVLPDVAALVSQAVQRAVQDEVDEAVDEAQEELEERVRGRLRDIFD